jgi:hypothetical protein
MSLFQKDTKTIRKPKSKNNILKLIKLEDLKPEFLEAL